jgi:hypothetical protein
MSARIQTPFNAHWLGRCPVKGCDCVMHFDVPMIRETWTETHHDHARGYSWEVHKQKDRQANYNYYGLHSLMLHCAKHKWQLRFKAINGRYVEGHVCDSRCMNAIGPNCDCSCGGANHGRGHHVELRFDLGKQVAA